MSSRTLHRFLAFLAVLAGLAALPSHAQLFRAYLSLNGSDANPCTLQQPCRLLPAALAAAADGGEIWMLNSANYNTGPVTVAKGIKILAIPGEMGSLVGNGGDALVINAPGRDVTLRNLVVLNLSGGINGVNIQDANAVHIEKTTVHDFIDPAGACIRYTNNTSTRIFVTDSFLRRCRTAIHATAPALPAGNRPSVVVDNTRIERMAISVGQAIGVWHQGCIDVTLRNSSIARVDIGILADTLVADCSAHLQVLNSQVTRATTGLMVNSATANGEYNALVVGSQLTQGSDPVVVTNNANSALLSLDFVDSTVSHCGNACMTLTNTAGDNVLGIQVNLVRSTVAHTPGDLVSANVPNGSRIRVWVRDSTLAHATGRILRTAGAGVGTLQASFIRSSLHSATYAVDHGFGQVRLDGNHMTNLTNTFVNSGSGDVRSMGNNWLTNFINTTPGFVYITPTAVAPI